MKNIAILGRPNVGKSTLFNRLVGRRKSIVDSTAGVTRDISVEKIYINGIEFNIFDTGGLLDTSEDILNEKVREKALKTATEESDILLFLVDAHKNHPDDKHFINAIRKSNKPIILVINKVDADSHNQLINEFYSLGIKEIVSISAEHNKGIEDLKEKILNIYKSFNKNEFKETKKIIENSENEDNKNLEEFIAEKNKINIAIVGKPNAGKSTLLNTLIGKERSIVSNIAGTTRDPIDETFNFNGNEICLIDTAGIRKKKNVNSDIEYYSVNRAIKSIEASDVCILMLDVFEGLTEQDKTIANLIIERKKGIVIAANKWDIREKGITWNDYETYMKETFPVLNYVFYAKVSATKKKDAEKLLSLAIRVAKTRRQKFETHSLTETFVRATREYTISAGGSPFKIFYATQTGINPPAFAIFCNNPHKLNSHYRRYLENKFREIFDFRGTPIILNFRKRGKKNDN